MKPFESAGYEGDKNPAELIASVTTLEELYTVLRTIGPIAGSQGVYDPESIIHFIEQSKVDKSRISTITNTYGIRGKVISLLSEYSNALDIERNKIAQHNVQILIDGLHDQIFNMTRFNDARTNVQAFMIKINVFTGEVEGYTDAQNKNSDKSGHYAYFDFEAIVEMETEEFIGVDLDEVLESNSYYTSQLSSNALEVIKLTFEHLVSPK